LKAFIAESPQAKFESNTSKNNGSRRLLIPIDLGYSPIYYCKYGKVDTSKLLEILLCTFYGEDQHD